ncbi:hypothetical protein [Microcoleus sp. herbarium12]|uniref:hypothetical protein n=1 Tax=Microcoleus sp. herbarium12 TaxID=3055437 RepID=UPI002FCF6E34
METTRGDFFRELSGEAQPMAGKACESLSTPRKTAFLLDFTLHRAQWGEVTLAELTGGGFYGRSQIEGIYVEGFWS